MTKNRTTTIPSETTSVKSENYTKNILQTGSNPVTMEASKSPAKESSDKAKAATHDALVYKVEEIAQILAISSRAAYNLCKSTKDFKVIRIGKSVRVNKQSFDNWLASA
jgi:predicted DNA-binding transcriptional regulator AlpA